MDGICNNVVNSVLESASRLGSSEENADDSFKYKFRCVFLGENISGAHASTKVILFFSRSEMDTYALNDEDVVDDDSKIGIIPSFGKNQFGTDSSLSHVSSEDHVDVKTERMVTTTTKIIKSASSNNLRRPNSEDGGPCDDDDDGSDSDEPGNLTIDIDSVVVERKHETQPLNLSVTLNNS